MDASGYGYGVLKYLCWSIRTHIAAREVPIGCVLWATVGQLPEPVIALMNSETLFYIFFRVSLLRATRHAELEAIDAILADHFSDTSQFATSKRSVPPQTQRFTSPSNLVSCVPPHSVGWVSNACSTVARTNDSEGARVFLVLTRGIST